MSPAPTPDDAPALRVVRGDTGPAELAALVAVLSALAAQPAVDGDAPTSTWNDRSAGLRRPLPHGRGAWHASGWPSR